MHAAAEMLDLIDGFGDPGRRHRCTHELATYGADAVPAIKALLVGELENRWGIPYKRVGEEYVRCGIITARLIGEGACELEDILARFCAGEDSALGTEAASALWKCGVRTDAGKAALFAALDRNVDHAYEAAHTLVALGFIDRHAEGRLSDRALELVARVRQSEERSPCGGGS